MGNIIKLTEEQFIKILNTELVNVSGLKNMFYKYMNWKRVHELLKSKELVFVSPNRWNDPYESKYLNTDFTSVSDYRQPPIYCTCVRNDNDNEEASWMIYKDKNDKLLRLSIKVIPFIHSLGQFAESNNYNLYLSKVSYRFNKKEIDNLFRPKHKGYDDFFSSFNEKKIYRINVSEAFCF